MRVPFVGLHVGDLLLHSQDVMLLLKNSLLYLVSKGRSVDYPQVLVRHACGSAAAGVEEDETYQRRAPIRAPSRVLHLPAFQPVKHYNRT